MSRDISDIDYVIIRCSKRERDELAQQIQYRNERLLDAEELVDQAAISPVPQIDQVEGAAGR